MTQEHIALERLDEHLVHRFVSEHIPQCQCLSPASRVVSNLRAAALRFIAVGRRAGLMPPTIAEFAPPLTAELDAFNEYLEGSRGLAATTRARRRQIVADFLVWRFRDDAPDPTRLRVCDVHGFLLERLGACAPGKAAVISGALRSYLRFCALRGQAVEALLAAVPTVAQWPLDRLPQVLSDALIASVECTFNRSTAGGLRDYALFRLMLDLGLRVSEVVSIQLQDIDWRAGTLRVATRKTHRVGTLPLSQAVANTIAQYLCEARPTTTQRTLFVRKTAPIEVPHHAACGSRRDAPGLCALWSCRAGGQDPRAAPHRRQSHVARGNSVKPRNLS